MKTITIEGVKYKAPEKEETESMKEKRRAIQENWEIIKDKKENKSFIGRKKVALEKAISKIEKGLKERALNKRVLRKNKMTVSIPDYKAPSILGDENRFFKGEMEREKRSMFFE